VGDHGQILYVNQEACRFSERSREELLALTIPDIGPLFPKQAWASFWENVKTRGSMTLETVNQTKHGRVFPVEVTANYLELDGQESVFSFVRDITQRNNLENQLRHAQKLESVGQLAAGIAHEINTPTQFVTDNLTFLRDSWKTTEELLELYRSAVRNAADTLPPAMIATLDEAARKADLAFIVAEVPRAIDQSLDGAHRVAQIVRAMKEFSHPDSADKSAADLNRAIESTITVARSEWKYVAEITTEFDVTLPAVLCYPGDINQVILNLLVNAAHAINDKISEGEMGRITVRTRTEGEFAEISVTDTGTGIPEAVRGRVFDPFFTTKEVGKGTGQGLALAHAVIVTKHGGKIWFETEMGSGTTFLIHLPIHPVAEVSVEQAELEPTEFAPAKEN
jgi:PAS domain S-box-containing protein